MYPGSGREWIAPFPAALRAGETWPALPPSGRRCRAAPLAFPGSDRGIAGRGQSAGSAACSRRAVPESWRAQRRAGGTPCRCKSGKNCTTGTCGETANR